VVLNPGRTISVLVLGQCHLDLPKFIDEKMIKLKREMFTVCWHFSYSCLVCPFLSRIFKFIFKFMFRKKLLL